MKETLKVEGMTCSCCVGKVEKSINQLDGVSSIKIDVDHKEVQVSFNKETVSLGQIKEKIEEEGYKVI
ncbi:copper ion binding protein [Pseudogracilibacillus auburnensis]|uniref:Copper chaperone CopZ n=1 Tax=Pseudogracilibacillus auburnensis TaxID=1494959 RepID=A0A2V3W501_9BACI|nr:copper ion binding protein [Pseudogracilibacillus auburnensis]MBO1001306.1 heavy-metal-associated domain-containing protein [Pseudogracilibacillus auburnensis]PXW83829.1 copper chaperone [Pseudogracilibacillus auburnensis]